MNRRAPNSREKYGKFISINNLNGIVINNFK